METRPGSSLILRVLGGFELRAADGRDLTPPGKKLRALMAFLSLQPGKAWPRGQLTALLWGDRDEEQARGSLRQVLAELRRNLSEPSPLLADRETVALDAASVTVDAVEFARLAAAGELESAAQLYRGELLDGLYLPDAGFADWLLVERTRLHDLGIDVLARLAVSQNGETAIRTAQRLLQLDPLREETHRELMRLYATGGQRAQALRQYQICRESLQRELGVKPEPETEQLCKDIQSSTKGATAGHAGNRPVVDLRRPSEGGIASAGVSSTAHRPWRWLGAAGAVLIVALAAGVIGWWRPWAPEPLPSIAVLPFKNISGDAQQGYLADGITEDLTTDLARVPGLFVISRNAALRYKDQRIAPTQVAAELGVRYIVEGSVRRVGDELRINAQLFDARDGGHLWAGRFDGAWGDVFAFQEQVIGQIVNALARRLPPRGQLEQGGTTVPAAYDAYLRGREHYLRFWSNTPQELAKAVPYFEQAIALDKDYGEAYAALAEVYRQAYGGREDALGVSPREAFAKMNEYFQQTLKHPSARGYRLAAYLAGLQGRFDDATTELERAIALDPSAPLNYTTMAWWLVRGGRLADSQRYLDAAFRLNPRFEEFSGDVIGMIEFCMDHFAEAAAIWERHLTRFPSDRYTRILLVAALGHLGREAEARQHYARANEYFTGNGRPPFTVLSAVLELPMKERTDAERIRDGLRKAGVPELPYGYDAASDDRLTDDEIKSLILGRTSRARDIDSGEECLYTTTIDGSPTVSCDSWTDTGSYPRLEDNVLCYWWAKSGQTCVTYFRNPGGTPERYNEFVAVTPHNRWEFSAVK